MPLNRDSNGCKFRQRAMTKKVYRSIVHRLHRSEISILKFKVRYAKVFSNWKESKLQSFHLMGIINVEEDYLLKQQLKIQKDLQMKLDRASEAVMKRIQKHRVFADAMKSRYFFDMNDSS